MYELKVVVSKVMGTCTSSPPMRPGDYFTVRDGDIRLPEGGSICLWAFQSLLPLITPKERELAEAKDEDVAFRLGLVPCATPQEILDLPGLEDLTGLPSATIAGRPRFQVVPYSLIRIS